MKQMGLENLTLRDIVNHRKAAFRVFSPAWHRSCFTDDKAFVFADEL